VTGENLTEETNPSIEGERNPGKMVPAFSKRRVGDMGGREVTRILVDKFAQRENLKKIEGTCVSGSG